MNYIEDETLMMLLSELSRHVNGLEYTLNSDWKNDKTIVEARKQELNYQIDNLKKYLIKI
jgi:hypothetical protein